MFPQFLALVLVSVYPSKHMTRLVE